MTLFINLPTAEISTAKTKVMPLSLLCVIAYLRDQGRKVDLIDLTTYPEESLYEYIRKNKPRMIGISVMVAGQMQSAIRVSIQIKQIIDTTIILGGIHASQFAEDILTYCKDIDLVKSGEYESYGGLCYRTRKGIHRGEKNRFADVNTLPMPAYDILNFENYRSDNSTWHNPFKVDLGIRVPVFTSRGCPNVCNFCSVQTAMGYKYRGINAIKVVDMFEWLNQRGIVYFAIYDANFSQSQRRVIEICNEIRRRNLRIYLDIPAGLPVNVSTSEMIDALVSVGLIRTKVAIENPDDTIRNEVMHKRVTRDQIYKSIEIIRKHKQVFLTADFIIGMPEETEKSLQNTIEFIEGLDIDDIGINIATPYPGTGLWDQCVRDKLFTVDYRTLWNDPGYSHTNLNRFTIKPYKVDIFNMSFFLGLITALKWQKQEQYEKRKDQKTCL